MRYLISIVCTIAFSNSYGQVSVNWMENDQNDRSQLEVLGEFTYGMTGLDNRIVPKLVFGGTLDSLQKSIASGDLEERNNTLSGEALGTITYIHSTDSLLGSDQLNWYAQLGYAQLFGLGFTKDAFDLLFYGNEIFEGGTAQLDLNTTRWHYQKLVLGISGKNTSWYGGLGIYKGSDWWDISTQNSRFTTQQGGGQIDFALNAEANYSDTANTGLTAFNGWGLGGQMGYVIKEGNGKPILSISVEDLGVMWWNKQSKELLKDTLYNYEGFDINDLLNDRIDFSNIDDTLELNSTSGQIWQWLPFGIRLEKLAVFNGRQIAANYGLYYRHSIHTIPEMYAGIVYKPSNTSLLNASIAYGGYYRLHMRFGINMRLSNEVQLAIQSRSLINSISNGGRGQSINFQLLLNI